MADRIIPLGTKDGQRLATGSRWPSSSAIEISGRPYVIDRGMGATRQFAEAGFSLADVDTILITHRHPDHFLELGPLLHATRVSSPERQIKVHGPNGVRKLIDDSLAAMACDMEVRMADERQQGPRDILAVTECTESHVFKDDLVEIDALHVVHAPSAETFALKAGRRKGMVVFSSDTSHFPPLAECAKGAGILVHEATHRGGTERM